MSRIRVLASRLLDPFLRARRDARVHEELASHLDLMVDDLISRGMSRGEAERRARLALGGRAQVAEACRDRQGFPLLAAWQADLHSAWRVLTRDARFSLTAVAVLGAGLAVNTTFFTVLNAICLRGLPIPEVDRVVDVVD